LPSRDTLAPGCRGLFGPFREKGHKAPEKSEKAPDFSIVPADFSSVTQEKSLKR
jgi:hypothetical protein